MDFGRSPMAQQLGKKTSSVITPTRKNFLANIAKKTSKIVIEDDPPPEREETEEEEEEDDTDIYSRLSPIPVKKQSLLIPSVKDEEEIDVQIIKEKEVETITRDHISPVRNTENFDLEDEDDLMERVNELISDSGKVDYNMEPKEVRDLCMETFKTKFQTLKINYPEQGIEFPEGKSLNKVHDKYHAIYKTIYVNMNLGQFQLGYIIILMAIEVVCIKAFNIPMSGFTQMEAKRIHRYNQLMVELGESMYSTGGGSWPLEWRIAGSILMNIAVFIAIKFLSKYVGGESMTDVIRNAVDNILDNPVTKEDIESGNINKQKQDTGLGGMMDGLMGGGGSGGGFADIIAQLGTNFTGNMEKKNAKAKAETKKRRFIFED